MALVKFPSQNSAYCYVVPKDEPLARFGRVYLDVPYPERDRAKEAHARFDRITKQWYIGKQADLKSIVKWRHDGWSPNLIVDGAFAVTSFLKPCPHCKGAMHWSEVLVEGLHSAWKPFKYVKAISNNPQRLAGAIYIPETIRLAMQNYGATLLGGDTPLPDTKLPINDDGYAEPLDYDELHGQGYTALHNYCTRCSRRFWLGDQELNPAENCVWHRLDIKSPDSGWLLQSSFKRFITK